VFVYFSDVEASRLRTHIDQTTHKEPIDYNLPERPKLGKARTPKSKNRQSPYTPSCETKDYHNEFEPGYKNEFEFGVPIPAIQSLQFSPSLITNAHAQESLLERYQSFYSSYGNQLQPSQLLKDCAYSCAPQQTHFENNQFRVSCEERFPIRESEYPHLNPASQSDPKLDETLQLVPLSRDNRPSGRCSRSSSRGEAFTSNLPLHETPSNRSESSASEVDVISDDLDGGRTDSKHCSKAYKERLNIPIEPVQQSVIMRMPNQNHTVCQSPRYSCDYSKSTLAKSPRANHVEVETHPSEHGHSPNGTFFIDDVNEKSCDGIKHIHSKALSEDQIMQCLRNNCPYESYNGGGIYPTSGIPGKPYPVVPQVEYTSVIVDPQRYQMPNGFVH